MVLAVSAAIALAGPVAAPPEPAAIVGGDPVGACAWPSVVSLGQVCTGTLVHPRVVLYAAHCGTAFSSVEFGASVAPRHARTVAIESCHADELDGLGAERDRAYCILASPVTDVPIVPPISGCETDVLQPGATATLVGFGQSEFGYGKKRAVTTTLGEVEPLQIAVGGEGRDSCQGDSGGPAFIRLDSGQWRVFGIISRGEACGEGGVVSRMDDAAQWAEDQAGFDLTPCSDDGAWYPTAACAGFSAAPDRDDGDWTRGCAQPLEGTGRTCGPAFDDEGDVTAPEVSFVGAEGDVYTGSILVDANDDGLGVWSVSLSIDGVGFATHFDDHPSFAPDLSVGEHQLLAIATDRAGNTAEVRTSVVVLEEAGSAPAPEDDRGCRIGPKTNGFSILLWAWMFSAVRVARRMRRS